MLKQLEKSSSLFWILTGIAFVVCIGIVDIVTGSELAFSVFYLIPIVIVTWFSGKTGLIISGASAVMWFIADDLADNPTHSL